MQETDVFFKMFAIKVISLNFLPRQYSLELRVQHLMLASYVTKSGKYTRWGKTLQPSV